MIEETSRNPLETFLENLEKLSEELLETFNPFDLGYQKAKQSAGEALKEILETYKNSASNL